MNNACLHVVMYHYVRDTAQSRFPNLHALPPDDFRRQVDHLRQRYEMASLAAALAFLRGAYRPRRGLCLLTFDDGLKEHLTTITPILAERRIQGLFFLITGCMESAHVAAVHKCHLLMAAMEFSDFRCRFLAELAAISPESDTQLRPDEARRSYRWDTAEVAAFKHLMNFRLSEGLRAQVLGALFAEHVGDEAAGAKELYVNWDEARQMQKAGMLLGGHSHRHESLARLRGDALETELACCRRLLTERLHPQALWPFSYPYGKPIEAFNEATARALAGTGFDCAFTTVVGSNPPGQDRYCIRRIDPKDLAAD